MITDIQITVKACQCNVCGYRWISLTAKPPESCRNLDCRSRQWDGKRQRSHLLETVLPAPRKPGRPKTITLIDDEDEEL